MNEYFNALNDYFDHIYVLTLDSAEQRQKNIAEVLKGLNWQFFPATDKKNLSIESAIEQNLYNDELHKQTKRTTRSMNLGEIACAISHRRMHQDMLDNGYNRVLICEDDVLPEPEKLRDFAQLIRQLPEDWELLMLGYYGHKLPTSKYKLQQQLYYLLRKLHLFNWHRVEKSWIDSILMQPFSSDWYQIGKVLGTHAYAINRSAAKKFIDYQTPVKLQADRIFNYYQAVDELKAYAPKSTLFTLSELSKISSIQ